MDVWQCLRTVRIRNHNMMAGILRRAGKLPNCGGTGRFAAPPTQQLGISYKERLDSLISPSRPSRSPPWLPSLKRTIRTARSAQRVMMALTRSLLLDIPSSPSRGTFTRLLLKGCLTNVDSECQATEATVRPYPACARPRQSRLPSYEQPHRHDIYRRSVTSTHHDHPIREKAVLTTCDRFQASSAQVRLVSFL